MNDLISRQAVNDALDRTCNRVCQYSKKQRYSMCGACPLGSAFDTVIEAPTLDPIAHLEAELNNAESEARFYGLEWKDGYKYALKVLKEYLGVK